MMRDGLTAYKIWAPDNALWTEWAKPVLFANMPYDDGWEPNPVKIGWASEVSYDTMVITDLPGRAGVEAGLALARLGYRPVPLYNGVFATYGGASMAVDVGGIVTALYKGADEMLSLIIGASAPPVFMLDYNRMSGIAKEPGKYDNRWCVFPQDMPSASFLLKKGITKAVVRAERIQEDLAHILRRYQEAGVKIFLCADRMELEEVTVPAPSRFKNLTYRFSVISGLVRNAAGGFGSRIPLEPERDWTSVLGGRHYGRYYGMG